MSGRRGSADEEELGGASATEGYWQHLEGKSSPADCWLHAQDVPAASKTAPYKNTHFIFLTKNKGSTLKQGFALN